MDLAPGARRRAPALLASCVALMRDAPFVVRVSR
jgi:hypothetical protein